MTKDITEGQDLGVKIGTKAEAEWTRMKKIQEQNILVGEVNVDVARKVLELCKEKIAEEKKK